MKHSDRTLKLGEDSRRTAQMSRPVLDLPDAVGPTRTQSGFARPAGPQSSYDQVFLLGEAKDHSHYRSRLTSTVLNSPS